MKIAVLGGGHGCYAAAAELSEKGHNVSFWRRDTEGLSAVIEAGAITVQDFRGEREIKIAQPTISLAEAVSGAQLIVIPLPSVSHENLSKELAPLLEEGQVVFLPPGTFGSMIFAQAVRQAGNQANISFAETGTLPGALTRSS